MIEPYGKKAKKGYILVKKRNIFDQPLTSSESEGDSDDELSASEEEEPFKDYDVVDAPENPCKAGSEGAQTQTEGKSSAGGSQAGASTSTAKKNESDSKADKEDGAKNLETVEVDSLSDAPEAEESNVFGWMQRKLTDLTGFVSSFICTKPSTPKTT